jgi:hypothetical protein
MLAAPAAIQACWKTVFAASADAGVPRIVTRIATPSAAAICRLVLTIPDPVPKRSAGRAVALVLISVGSASPTPMPVSNMLGSRSAT